MATKAQLEAELADLKMQLAQRGAATDRSSEAEIVKPVPSAGQQAGDGLVAPDTEPEDLDWEAQLQDLLRDLEDLPQKKPLLLALGALALGYLIGRSRQEPNS